MEKYNKLMFSFFPINPTAYRKPTVIKSTDSDGRDFVLQVDQ
jgi:hypothetical protein